MTSRYSAYQAEWRKNNPEKIKQYKAKQSEYNKHRTIVKRCPSCGKHNRFRKDSPLLWKTMRCKHCKTKMRVIRTLSDSNKNIHGCKLVAV